MGAPGKILHVSGLSQRTRDIDLENRFAKYGKVVDCKVIRDKRSGMGRGYAFVTMETDQQADECVTAVHRTEFEGHVITVEKVRLRSRACDWCGTRPQLNNCFHHSRAHLFSPFKLHFHPHNNTTIHNQITSLNHTASHCEINC
jgi:RNA recognition motif-containing protein